MNDSIKIEFKQSTVENLQLFSEMLKKDINTMLEEALEQYRVPIEKTAGENERLAFDLLESYLKKQWSRQ